MHQVTDLVTGPASHFTNVEDRQQAGGVDLAVEQGAPAWVILAAIAVLGVLIAAGAWYGTRPPSADQLYQRIVAAAEQGDPQQLLDVETDIQQFLEHFADDPRSGEIEGYRDELQLDRVQRRFERRTGRGITPNGLSAVEHTYREATQLALTHPEAAADKLQALLDLFDDGSEDSPFTEAELELARVQLQRLRQTIQQNSARHLALLEQRLQRAEQLHSHQPQAAQAIWQAIVELYQDKPWAADVVQQARQSLQDSRERP